MMYIYVIEYDGQISMEGYSTEEKAIEHLEKSIVDNVIATNIINLLSDILQNALAKSLTKENIEALKNMEVKDE